MDQQTSVPQSGSAPSDQVQPSSEPPKDPLKEFDLSQWVPRGDRTEGDKRTPRDWRSALLDRVQNDRDEFDLPAVLVSGDASRTQILLRRENPDIKDRLRSKTKIDTYTVPGGTFFLEFLVNRILAARRPDHKTSPRYAVRGPHRRGWIGQSFSILTLDHFPSDTTIVEQTSRGTSSPDGRRDSPYRVHERLGYSASRYRQQIDRVRADITHLKEKTLLHYFGLGRDDNYCLMRLADAIDDLQKKRARTQPFVHIINIEFDHFGTAYHTLPDSDLAGRPIHETLIANAEDRIADASRVIDLEQDSVEHAFVVKVRQRGVGDTNRSDRDDDIRKNLVTFLRTSPTVSGGEPNGQRGTRTVMVVSADDLRQANVYVPSHLSWERSLQGIVWHLKVLEEQVNQRLESGADVADALARSPQGYLLLAGTLVVSLGCDAALVIAASLKEEQTQKQIKYDITDLKIIGNLAGREGDAEEQNGPRVRGVDSLIAASLATHLIEEMGDQSKSAADALAEAPTAVLFGLKAARIYQIAGEDLFQEHWKSSPRYSGALAYAEVTKAAQQQSKNDLELADLPVPPIDLLAEVIANHHAPVVWLDGKESERIKKSEEAEKSDEIRKREEIEKAAKINARYERLWRDAGFLHSVSVSSECLKTLIELPQEGTSVRGSLDPYTWSLFDEATNALPRGLVGRSLLVANVALVHGLDVFLPSNSKDLWRNQGRILNTIIDTRLNVGESLTDVMQDVLAHCHWTPTAWQGLATLAAEATWRFPKYEWNSGELAVGESHTLFTHGGQLKWQGSHTDATRLIEAMADVMAKPAGRAEVQVAGRNPWVLGFPSLTMDKLQCVDRVEVEAFRSLERVMSEYLRRPSLRPLSLGVFGPPGSGKSTGVKAVIKSVFKANAEVREFNLSQFTGPDGLADAFAEIQDIGIQGKLPVVFWDEFDSTLASTEFGWLQYFLGPMQDGAYFHHSKSRRLPKCVFVFAGSKIERAKTMQDYFTYGTQVKEQPESREIAASDDRKKMMEESANRWVAAKGNDFRSRLTATLDVLGVNEDKTTETRLTPAVSESRETWSEPPESRSSEPPTPPSEPRALHYVRRALVLRHVLSENQPELFDDQKRLRVPANVARGFLELKEYRYNSRSIEQIVKMCDLGAARVFESASIPSAQQFSLHGEPKEFERLAELPTIEGVKQAARRKAKLAAEPLMPATLDDDSGGDHR